jgi:arginine/lysine/ornithine decarboxylase
MVLTISWTRSIARNYKQQLTKISMVTRIIRVQSLHKRSSGTTMLVDIYSCHQHTVIAAVHANFTPLMNQFDTTQYTSTNYYYTLLN